MWRKGWKRHGSQVVSDTPLSETDGPLVKAKQDSGIMTKRELTTVCLQEMQPDKELEERVLYDCSEHLTNNLPADDIAPAMVSVNLLTPKEYDEYKVMKRSGRSTMTGMSEYLIECLNKREGGFLGRFCNILSEIEAAKYLGDDIRKAYHEAVLHRGFNPITRERLSKLSTSDPELRPNTPQGSSTTKSCTVCKTLKKRNRQLEKFNSELKEQLIEQDKEYRRLYEAKIKIEGQLEILNDQLNQEKESLKQVVPQLQEAMALIERSCYRATSAISVSGTQQTLNRITGLMQEQGKPDKRPTVLMRRHIRVYPSDSSKRDSTLSIFSDTSSVTENSSLADEDLSRSHSSDSPTVPERYRLSTDLPKPVVSDLHRSLTHSQTVFKEQHNQTSLRDVGEPLEPVQVTEGLRGSSSLAVKGEIQSQQLAQVSDQGHQHIFHREAQYHHPNVRSSSSPDIDVSATRSVVPKVNVRHTRLLSEPDEIAKQGRSQSFRRETKVKPYSQLRATGNVLTSGSELSKILSKRREKVDSESKNSVQLLIPKSQ